MKKNQTTGDYKLLDSGEGRKLEQFGEFVISRPCEVATWERSLSPSIWNSADAAFALNGNKSWIFYNTLPKTWIINTGTLSFKLSATPFGHIGIFPEQIHAWSWITESIRASNRKNISVLNLFAYTGGASLAAAIAGANVCHLDASKSMTQRARENAFINQLQDAPVRWIIDDVHKFLKREKRRNRKYDAIILDPPSFGHGKSGEVFKIEKSLNNLLHTCVDLLSIEPLFVYMSCHTPSFTQEILQDLLEKALENKKGKKSSGELLITGNRKVHPIPSGTYTIWQSKPHAPDLQGK